MAEAGAGFDAELRLSAGARGGAARPRGTGSEPRGWAGGFAEAVCSRLREEKPVRRKLPVWGRLHIDRPLPFLCVYRRPVGQADAGTEQLLLGEASYLLASAERRLQAELASLVEQILTELRAAFGGCLLLELWAEKPAPSRAGAAAPPPHFRLLQPPDAVLPSTLERFEAGLRAITILNRRAEVETSTAPRIAAPGLPPLLSTRRAQQLGCHLLGLEVRPVYRDSQTGQGFPLIQRRMQRGIARTLKRGLFRFTCEHTTHRPPHYHALGRRSMVKSVWEVDRQLAAVSSQFDLLLLLSPTNADRAWSVFKRKHCDQQPVFSYRPLPVEPALLKRQLFRIPIERVEDPTLEQLFRDQQRELDRKISLLADRGSPAFLPGSLQLYGAASEELVGLAEALLERLPYRSREDSKGGALDAKAFAARAEAELDYYRGRQPGIASRAIVRDDVSGLMVSRGNLLIGSRTQIPVRRAEALLQHEVGTHIVTYLNGMAQPFRQLSIGLPGYDELQEGLAVLAEYLVGGLTRPRLRLLAARVVAVQRMLGGASFVDLFRDLNRDYGLEQRTAFTVSMRVFRSGGFSKDVAYLRGLVELLDYLAAGNAIEALIVGKIGAQHVRMVRELQWRKVLRAPPLLPRYLEDARSAVRLAGLREGRSILQLIEGEEP